jgi:hypothetical protein
MQRCNAAQSVELRSTAAAQAASVSAVCSRHKKTQPGGLGVRHSMSQGGIIDFLVINRIIAKKCLKKWRKSRKYCEIVVGQLPTANFVRTLIGMIISIS